MPPKTFDITQENVKGFKLPEYNNGLATEQNGTFTQEWVFDKSEYNSVISGFIKEGSGYGLAQNGIDAASSLEELQAIENNLNNDIIDEIDVVELDEIIDIDVIDDIELEFFYELDDTEELSMNEFSELLKKSDIQLEEENVKKLFISLDKNGNGQLDYTEVMRLVDYFSRKKIYTKKTELSKEPITEKISVNIDTRFRPEYYKTTSSEFDYEMPDVQKNVINMKIGSVEMPMTSNTISSKLNNNTFLIISDANTRTEEYDISGSWRFHTQIGDISADYLHGTIQENTKITVDDTSYGRISGFTHGNGQGYYSNLGYLTRDENDGIIPIKNVTFEKMDPPVASTDNPDVSSNESLAPLEALKTGRFTSLSDVREISTKDSHTFKTKVDNNLYVDRSRDGNTQYSCIFRDEDTPHPEDSSVTHQYEEHQVPGKTEIVTKTEVVDYRKTITTTTTFTKYYNFIRSRTCKWKQGVWNGFDGTGTGLKKYVMYTEINNDEPSNGQPSINIYSPRGNPRRTDVNFDNLTYIDGSTIDPPYDCKRMNEKTTDTKIKKQIHLKALRYKSLQDGKENTDFNPVKYAWLVTLPDGNYDEIINNKGVEFELVVNDAIGIAIPGAVDNVGNFCAIIEPDDYNYINNANNALTQNSVFVGEDANTHVIPGYEPELNYSKDSISKRSIFTTPTFINNNNNNNNSGTINNIVSRIIKVNKFTVREGQSGLRTTFGGPNDWGTSNQNTWENDGYVDSNNVGHMPRQGEPYPEMMALLSKSREPKMVVKPIKSNPKEISNIKFNIDSYGNEDNDTNIQYKLGWILGFRTGQYELAQNEDDKENIENTIDLASVKSLRAEQTLFENRERIAENLTPEAMELLSRAKKLVLDNNETDFIYTNGNNVYNDEANNDEWVEGSDLLADIREYVAKVYQHATNIDGATDAIIEDTKPGNYYNTGGSSQGQTNEYYTIMRVAEKSMKSLYLTGIGSNRGITISKLYHKIDPDLLANNNDALPLDTKADLLEFAELTVEIGYYDIAMYSNYEILKKASDKIKAGVGNIIIGPRLPSDHDYIQPGEGSQPATSVIPNNNHNYQQYHAVVKLPPDEYDFAKAAADVAYIWLYAQTDTNVQEYLVHTADLDIYPARDINNQKYLGLTAYEHWEIRNSINHTGQYSQNDWPWYLPALYLADDVNGLAEEAFNAKLALAESGIDPEPDSEPEPEGGY